MKRIFEGEIYEILPLPNGIVFSYCKESNGTEITVSYKMISFDTGGISDVAKNIYLMAKFGNNYKEIIKHCDNYITVKSIVSPRGKVFLLLNDGTAKLIDTDFSVIWQGNFNYRDVPAADIVVHKNAVWATFPDCNVLLRYNLSTMREELRIGGLKSPFDKPRNMFLEGSNVTICNKGSKKLTKVNLDTFLVLDGESFTEEVVQYLKTDIYRFVVLKSGLYML